MEPDGLRVSDEEFAAARAQWGDDLRARHRRHGHPHRAVQHELAARRGDWSFESEPGLCGGRRSRRSRRQACSARAAKASYPSVLAQLGGPAVVAQVPTIAVVVPPKPGANGAVDPVVLAVAEPARPARGLPRVNGPAGVAALAFGTERIPKVVKVVGPGRGRSRSPRSRCSATAPPR